jgi:hypothetical protein
VIDPRFIVELDALKTLERPVNADGLTRREQGWLPDDFHGLGNA